MKIFILFLMFMSGVCTAQNVLVQGTIKDSLDGHPLPYATIKIKNSVLGVISDETGKFVINNNSKTFILEVSLIGYKSKTITIVPNHNIFIDVDLVPMSYQTEVIDVSPLTWAEKFILESISKNKQSNIKLNYYKADAYSKTIFSQKNNQMIGLIESISELNFQKPEKFQEKVIALKIPPHMKNLPYSSVAINQEININNDFLKIQNISFISPLNKDALKYYDYSFNARTVTEKDSIVVIQITPKINSVPLWEGHLTFNEKNFRLIEAQLTANDQSKTAILDSIQIFQQYKLQDSIFNFPVFSKCKTSMNCVGLSINFDQEYTITNYRVNDSTNRPQVSIVKKQLIEDIKPDFDLDQKRNDYFKVPLTFEEVQHNNIIDSIFNKTSALKRLFLYAFIQFPPLLLDENAAIGNLNIKHFSNWYHFNKAEGHYLGFEFNGYSNEQSSMSVNAGYGFSSHLVTINLFFNWEQFNLKISRSIKNLGDFPYNITLHTLEALINHEDNYNYFISNLLKLEYVFSAIDDINISPYVHLEKQQKVESQDEFSVFNKNRKYTKNFSFIPFNNNKAGLRISFNQETESWGLKSYSPIKGLSTTDLAVEMDWSSRPLLNSDENGYNFSFQFHRYQEIYKAINLDFSVFLKKQSETTHLPKLNFINSLQSGEYQTSALSFFTLENYQYILEDFFSMKTEINLIKLPEFLSLRTTIGAVFSFLRPLNTTSINDFPILQQDFQEYGISVKGISFFNLYLLRNTLSKNNLYFRFNFGL